MKKYLGIIGDPLEHTFSPQMHNAALQSQGVPLVYLPFRVDQEDLAAALLGFKAIGLIGFNVTIPHKVAIMSHLDEIAAEARLIGAVNTVKLENGRWVGYNTDGKGFLRSLIEETGFSPENQKVLILGAGGAARAVAVQMGLAGSRQIRIANRTLAKGEELARELGMKLPEVNYDYLDLYNLSQQDVAEVQIIINTTPVGMKSVDENRLPLDANWFHPEQLAVDLIYQPLNTPFLRLAKSQGLKTVSGLGMLLYQGVLAYQIWTGKEPPIQVMHDALKAQLSATD